MVQFSVLLIKTDEVILMEITVYGSRLLIQFINNKNEASWKGYIYAAGLLVGSCSQLLVLAQYFVTSQRTGMYIR